jgi:hypothetical protein
LEAKDLLAEMLTLFYGAVCGTKLRQSLAFSYATIASARMAERVTVKL